MARPPRIVIGFIAASTAWAAALPAAALVAARAVPGMAGYILAAGIYAVGSVVCHQIPERSFHLLGRQLPVCARCAGIYVGSALIALAAAFGPGNRPLARSGAKVLVLVACVPTAATLAFEWLSGVAPSNAVRAAAGFALGGALSWLVVRQFTASDEVD
jgi:uncharacterized membrane protein